MADDIEERLSTAAKAVREREVTALRCRDLADRIAELTRLVAERRAVHTDEQEDVERLEGMSLTRVLASLRGARDDSLARERAEAEAARYRLAEVSDRLEATRREHAAAEARLTHLADAPAAYAAALDERERYLRESGDPRGGRLLELATERGQLVGEVHELDESVDAARRAALALSQVADKLGSASSWSTFDTYFGGEKSSWMKHERLDEAARAAAYADQRLAALRTELADVPGMPRSTPRVVLARSTRFVDIWFDSIFTDLEVQNLIKKARQNVARSRQLVGDVHDRLTQRLTRARARLGEIEAERRALLDPAG